MRGWPSCVTFHEGRLWWLGAPAMPVCGSQSNFYTGFAEEDSDGNTLGDAGAILEDFGQGPQDTVSWAVSALRLLGGREQSIASARSDALDQPMTANNFSVKDCSTQGAERLPAVRVDKRIVYVQQSGRRIYELFFDARELDYSPRDLTRLNLDIGKPGFSGIDVAHQPDKQIILPSNSGQAVVLLYDVDDEVQAFWRIQTLGSIEARARDAFR